MSDNIFWVLELAIKPVQADAFNAVMSDMVAATEAN